MKPSDASLLKRAEAVQEQLAAARDQIDQQVREKLQNG